MLISNTIYHQHYPYILVREEYWLGTYLTYCFASIDWDHHNNCCGDCVLEAKAQQK